MQEKTLLEVIDNVKSGKDLNKDEYTSAILALYSMLSISRISIENIASHIGNETNIHVAARCLFGNLDFVRKEKSTWLESTPKAWLILNNKNIN